MFDLQKIQIHGVTHYAKTKNEKQELLEVVMLTSIIIMQPWLGNKSKSSDRVWSSLPARVCFLLRGCTSEDEHMVVTWGDLVLHKDIICTHTNVDWAAFWQNLGRTNPSFNGLSIPLLRLLNDSLRKSSYCFCFPQRALEYTVGRRNGSVLQLHYSHSFFVKHVPHLFSIH